MPMQYVNPGGMMAEDMIKRRQAAQQSGLDTSREQARQIMEGLIGGKITQSQAQGGGGMPIQPNFGQRIMGALTGQPNAMPSARPNLGGYEQGPALKADIAKTGAETGYLTEETARGKAQESQLYAEAGKTGAETEAIPLKSSIDVNNQSLQQLNSRVQDLLKEKNSLTGMFGTSPFVGMARKNQIDTELKDLGKRIDDLNKVNKQLEDRQLQKLQGNTNANVNAKPKKSGGVLKMDAQGNKAYVYPDGTFEEVQ
ncbi:hypothetical protein CCP1ISM_50009 [Azospirillaceae bacterium]